MKYASRDATGDHTHEMSFHVSMRCLIGWSLQVVSSELLTLAAWEETQTCTPSRANQRTYGFMDVNPVSSRHSGLKSATPLLHEPFKGGMSTRCSLIGLMREQLVFLSHNVQVTVTPGNSREQNSFKGTRRATGQEWGLVELPSGRL